MGIWFHFPAGIGWLEEASLSFRFPLYDTRKLKLFILKVLQSLNILCPEIAQGDKMGILDKCLAYLT